MHSLKAPQIKRAAAGGRAAGNVELQRRSYHPAKGPSSDKSGNFRLCTIDGCIEPRCGGNGFCAAHDRQYYRERYRSRLARGRAWFDARREAVIRALLAASTPAEREAIQRGRVEGRKLRREAEALLHG